MQRAIRNLFVGKLIKEKTKSRKVVENLAKGKAGHTYTVRAIETPSEDTKDFLFTLGCYEGERVTIISILSDTYVIVVKDARYSIDRDLAKSIKV